MSTPSQEPEATGASAPAPDPMNGFRGVMSGVLVLEAITVGLALFTVADLYGGLNSVVGYLVGFDILALLVTVAAGMTTAASSLAAPPLTFSGQCQFAGTSSFGSTVTLVPSPTHNRVSATGTCSGSLRQSPWTY